MLSPDQIEEAGERVASVYREIEARMLDHLARAMAEGWEKPPRTVTEAALLAQSKAEELRRMVEEFRPYIDAAVLEVVEECLEASDEDDVARAGGSPEWPAQIDATVRGMAEVLARDNIQMAEGAKQAFLNASIEAVTRVNSGEADREAALHRAVRKLERDGIDIVTYQDASTGRVTVRNKADVAVRRHVRTQIVQDAQRMTMARMERLGIDLVEVSSHSDARESHAEWQGQCYSLKGEQVIDGTVYPDFWTSCMSGDLGDILGGVNCRHSYGPYRHGAPRMYEPDPQHPSGLPGAEVYELEQGQRYRESKIREAKRELRGAQVLYGRDKSAANLDAVNKARQKLRNRQEKMRAYIDGANAKSKTGKPVLHRKPDREWAGDMPKTTRKPAIMGRMRQEEPLVSLGGREQNGYSVSPSVNTRGYHAAFEKMPVPKPVAEGAYREAGRILERATGENEEFMAAIDAKTGARIVDNLGRAGTARHTYFNNEEMAAIESHRGNVVVIHNHPHSGAPSYGDVVTAARNDRIEGSVVVGHDGSVWFISASNPSIADKLERVYNAAKDALGDNAQLYALDSLIKRARKEGFVWKQLR